MSAGWLQYRYLGRQSPTVLSRLPVPRVDPSGEKATASALRLAWP